MFSINITTDLNCVLKIEVEFCTWLIRVSYRYKLRISLYLCMC